MKKHIVLILLVIACCFICSCDSRKPVSVVKNGEVLFDIVIPENPSNDIRDAVKLFRTVIKNATGASFEVYQEDDNEIGKNNPILFGCRKPAGLAIAALPLYSFVYFVSGDYIYIEGNGDGTYVEAVETLLNELVGYDPESERYSMSSTSNDLFSGTETRGNLDFDHGRTPLDESHFDESESIKRFISEGYALEFAGADGYGLTIKDANNGQTLFCSEKPLTVRITERRQATGSGFQFEKEFSAKYSNVIRSADGYTAAGDVLTGNGSVIRIIDFYYIENGIFCIDRTVGVVSPSKRDAGFESVFSVSCAGNDVSSDDCEYFVPGLLFKDTTYMETSNPFGGSLFSDLSAGRAYARTVSTPLPSAMVRSKSGGYSLTLQNVHPDIENADTPVRAGNTSGDKSLGYVTGEAKYGAIGYSFAGGVSVDFVYPAAEGPYTYENSNFSWICRYSPLDADVEHKYTLALIVDRKDSYNDAMVASYLSSFALESPLCRDVDIEELYRDQMVIYDKLFTEYKSSDGKTASAGLFFDASVKTGEPFSPVSYLFGFSGAQSLAAFQMYREGLTANNESLKKKAVKMLDFWSSDTINSGALPAVWWIPNSTTGGNANNYASFLRVFVDGMESVADAYSLSVRYGEKHQNWLDAAIKTADFLVSSQSEEGTWCRAYYTDGSPARTGKLAPGRISTAVIWGGYDGKSPLASECAVRFLYKMYKITGNKKYAVSAKKAAEWAYGTLYSEMGKYVGVCPDHINIVDKESSIYAMYCFISAYELTGDQKYVSAAVHAAVCAMSFVYVHDFAVKETPDPYRGVNIMENGGMMGTSIIATGYYTTDEYSSVTYSEYYELYKTTGDRRLLEIARFIQANTKSLADTDGSMGWFSKGVSLEATNGITNVFSTAGDGVWLPWISACFCDPYIDLYDKYGCGDVFRLK
ncbi:MAG: hypothetical protein J5563_00490 [Clostridia bacterium]|nr:hypothetical protein [Clostridia bacterium]